MAVIYGDNLGNSLGGTAGADSIYGLGGNDTLRGGMGDRLYGDVGEDVYFFDWQTADASSRGTFKGDSYVFEQADGGYDALNLYLNTGAWAAYVPLNVEEMNIFGSAYYVFGNDSDNLIDATHATEGVSLDGKAGDDILYGSDYDDSLLGGGGADGMVGGRGNDFYKVDNSGDIVIEFGGGGMDEVLSTLSTYRLPNNVEIMYLDGLKTQTGRGNASNNVFSSGEDYTRFVYAGIGNDSVYFTGNASDIVEGGAGNDTLQAGLGDDVYRAFDGFDSDEISDAGGDDAVEFNVDAINIWLKRVGDNLNVSLLGTQNNVVVKNFFSDGNSRVEELDAVGGKFLRGSAIDSLVSTMSAFVPPSSASSVPTSVQLAINNLWQ